MKYLRRVRLFAVIVWRAWDVEPTPPAKPFRLNVGLSWKVACIIHR